MENPYPLHTPEEVALELAQKTRRLRLYRNWKQTTLAERSGVTLASLRRFERTGEVSLKNLLRLCFALGRLDDFQSVLLQAGADSIRELEAMAAAPQIQAGNTVNKLDVRLTFAPGEYRTVGQLAEADRRIYFEYDDAFLSNPLWLSPFKLPPERGLREHRDLSFGPLFGLFDDSLPDGWGLLLMDRHFARLGVLLETISPLDRLAYLGERTMGALTYHPPARQEAADHLLLDLHGMSHEAYRVMAGKSGRLLPQLLRAGGSPGGARPKVLVGVRGDEMISGEDVLPDGYSAWLVKFHTRRDAVDEGRIEYAYAQMAQAAGVSMPATRLFTTQAGDAFFGVERFDREQNRRRHVHTFGNLIHSNFRIPSCDYELLLKVARVLTKNQADVQGLFRLMVFNILTHNRDDHVKNFAFMLDDSGAWRCAPAYDLTFAPGPGGEHTMTVAGEGREPGREHILRIADQAGIARRAATEIVEAVATAAADWPRFARDTGLGAAAIRTIGGVIRACLKRVCGTKGRTS